MRAPSKLVEVLRRGPNPLRGEQPVQPAAQPLRILFLVSAHNSLSQRAQVALTELGHQVSVAVVDSAMDMEMAVAQVEPELIVCPILKKIIPESIWSQYRCLIVHPGPRGDKGPSSLDWAIELGAEEWGVTVLEATGDVDGGAVWATRNFPVRDTGKSSLYRHEVRRGAIEGLLEALAKLELGIEPEPLAAADPRVIGRERPLIRQPERAIDWSADSTDLVVRRIRAAEGHPGVLDNMAGTDFHLFGVHREAELTGPPGRIVATRDGAICRATVDGAVWITHLKVPEGFKLPATRALELAGHVLGVPEVPAVVHTTPKAPTFREISYEEHAGVGYLHFDFYNGAMSVDQCKRLRWAYQDAIARSETNVIVLMGGEDFFSNGIHLNVIEAAEDQGLESWLNLVAIDDVVREIVETDSHIVISALSGDAAAGGVPFALAADHVVAREHVVLNPYYQHMGGLYGSEYWTYLLPRRVGPDVAARVTSAPFRAVGTREAVAIGLVDDVFGENIADFRAQVRGLAERLARDPRLDGWLEEKRVLRARDEARKPLAAYRNEELARSYECFFGADRSYHEARRRFVYKVGAPCAVTPPIRTSTVAALAATGRASGR
jgi:putative two-component system protein, hydrogenase maturation factor HypX/HoxX